MSQVHHLFITASLATQHPHGREETERYIKSAAGLQMSGPKDSASRHQHESNILPVFFLIRSTLLSP